MKSAKYDDWRMRLIITAGTSAHFIRMRESWDTNHVWADGQPIWSAPTRQAHRKGGIQTGIITKEQDKNRRKQGGEQHGSWLKTSARCMRRRLCYYEWLWRDARRSVPRQDSYDE